MVKQSEFHCIVFFIYLFIIWGGGSYGVNKLIVTNRAPNLDICSLHSHYYQIISNMFLFFLDRKLLWFICMFHCTSPNPHGAPIESLNQWCFVWVLWGIICSNPLIS